MTLRDLRNIHTIRNSCRDTLPCITRTKTYPIFLPADGEASWSLLPSSIKHLPGDRSGLRKPKKDKHQH